ncbi:MAG: hypothetical protein QM598_03710, partial [Protaetiibacter sp.]
PASAETASPLAPAVQVTGADSVRLDWEAQDAAVDPSAAYRVDVLGATGTEPAATHVLGDPALASVTDGVAPGRVAASLTGLAADTDYRFRIAVLAGDGTEVLLGEPSGVVRTAPAPIAETPAPEEPEAAAAEPEAPSDPAATVPGGSAETDSGSADDAATAARVAPLLSALAADPVYPAPKVTVRGATAVEVDDAAFRGSLSYPTIRLEFQDETGVAVKTVSAGLLSSVTVVSGLAPATSYRVQAVLYEYDENWNEVESRRSEPTAVFTTRAVVEAPGVIPAVPALEPLDGSQMRVSWAAGEDGGDVRTYTVRLYDASGTLVQTKTGVDPFTAGTQHIFTGLNALTGYTATVQAIGYEIGTPQLNGLESARSDLTLTLRGVPGKPGTPVLAAGAAGTTDIVVSWTAPVSDGGYPVTSYDLEFYTSASVSTGGNILKVRVPGDATSWTFRDAAYVEVPIVAVVSANNLAGTSARSGYSDTATAAKSPVKALATPKTAPSNANSATGIQLTAPTDDGFTVTWTLPAGTVAGTGYLIRVMEHLPSNAASSTAYTYLPAGAPETAALGQINARGIVDVGTFAATSGRLSATLTGLDGGRTYRVSVTPYVEADGVRAYRISSGASSAAISTTGSGVPAAGAKAKAPVATGVDSLSWTGDVLAERYDGGSPITGYRVALYRSGAATPLQLVDATLDGGVPSAVFTGLERATAYQVAYAGVNANGVGAFSEPSAPVSTLSRPAPGSVPPPYATLAELRAGVAAHPVTVVQAAAAGLEGRLESGTAVTLRAPYAVEELGEVWLYSADGAPVHQATFTADGTRASASWTLADLATGEYTLLALGDGGTMVAVDVAILKPVIGRTELDDAVFRWGFNDESSNGAFFGGCNYFVAGKAPDAGGAQVFTPSRYSSQDGNVTIVKPNAAGEYVQASWATKCLTRDGVPVTSSVTTPVTEQQIVITGGAGWVDPSTRSAEIAWDGDFTVVYYGGLTFWYGSDPVLRVEDGVGTVTATLSGYGADMDDLTKWEPIAPRQVTLATLRGVQMTSSGFTVTPDYLGVAVEIEPGSSAQAVPQPARTADNAAYWGSFPQDFVDFQLLTGQSAYWYTSGGSQDRGKPTLPLTVVYDSILDDTGAGEGGGGTGVEAPEAQAPPRNAGLSRPVATAQATSIDGIDTLRQLIESGVVTRLSASAAGIPDSVPAGQRLDFSFAWDGDDTEGVIWLYPDVVYVGTFRIVDGVVHVAVDSSVILTEGENFAVFFGDAGTAVAVSFLVDGRLAATAVDSAEDAAETPAVTEIPALPISDPADQAALLWLLLAGGGGLAVLAAAGAGTVLVLRRRGVPLGG